MLRLCLFYLCFCCWIEANVVQSYHAMSAVSLSSRRTQRVIRTWRQVLLLYWSRWWEGNYLWILTTTVFLLPGCKSSFSEYCPFWGKMTRGNLIISHSVHSLTECLWYITTNPLYLPPCDLIFWRLQKPLICLLFSIYSHIIRHWQPLHSQLPLVWSE